MARRLKRGGYQVARAIEPTIHTHVVHCTAFIDSSVDTVSAATERGLYAAGQSARKRKARHALKRTHAHDMRAILRY